MTNQRSADSLTFERADLLRRSSDLAAAGVPFALATVVRIEPPSSARPGHRAIVHRDGSMEGWIGGGCASPTVRRESMRALATATPRYVRITPDVRGPAPDGVVLAPMTCSSGGTVDVWIEPFLPAPALVVGGSSPVAAAVAELGQTLGFRVVTHAEAHGDACESVDAIIAGLEQKGPFDAQETWLVAVSHGEFDDELIEAGIRLGFRYAGLIASEKRAAVTRVRLHQRGLDDGALGAFHPSAGLRIGAKTPQEIALAVLGEIVALRRTATVVETENESEADASEASHCCHHAAAEASEPAHAMH
jgi:xanthine dehydrogenase accessory factor